MANPHTQSVGLIHYHGLDLLASPQMEPLFLRTSPFPCVVQMFKDDYIGIIKDSDVHDEVSSFYGDVLVDTLGFRPESGHLFVSMLLGFLNSVYRMSERVVFFR